MRLASWFSLGLLTTGLACSTYACGGDDNADDDTGDDDGGATSGSSSGRTGSSGTSTSGSSGTTSSASSSGQSSSGASSSSSGGESSTSSSSGESSSSSSSGDIEDAGPDATLEPDAGEEDAGSDAGVEVPGSVLYLGRWAHLDDGDADGPSASWPGTRVVINFHGTTLKTNIKQTDTQPSGGRSRYDIFIDGALVAAATPATETASLVVTADAATEYTLASGLTDADHTLTLIRRTEPQQGVNHFKSFTVSGGAAPKLLAPPARPTRVIEFLTESTANGFGVDSPVIFPADLAASRNCAAGPAVYNNARKSFPNKVAEHYGAEVSLLGISAIGITGNSSHNAAFKFGNLYPRINPFVNDDTAANTWPATARPAQVVFLMLGGADYEDPNRLTTAAQFVPELTTLVSTVRTRNPAAHIFMVVGPQIKESYPNGAHQRQQLKLAMDTVKANLGDAKIYSKQFTEENEQDTYERGCAYHGNEALHTLMTNEAEPWIDALGLGW